MGEHGATDAQQGRRPLSDLKPSGDVGKDDFPRPAIEEVGVIIHDD